MRAKSSIQRCPALCIVEIILYHRYFRSKLKYPVARSGLLQCLCPSGCVSPPQIFELNRRGWGEDVKFENRLSSVGNSRSNVIQIAIYICENSDICEKSNV